MTPDVTIALIFMIGTFFGFGTFFITVYFGSRDLRKNAESFSRILDAKYTERFGDKKE